MGAVSAVLGTGYVAACKKVGRSVNSAESAECNLTLFVMVVIGYISRVMNGVFLDANVYFYFFCACRLR